MKLLVAVYRRVDHLVHEFAKFGVVGAIGMVVDLGAYNILKYDFGGVGILHEKPLTARTVSIVLATLVTYFGNRFWTYKTRERRKLHHEYALFFVLNFVGLAINLAMLGAFTYVLQLTGPFWDNVANVLGIGLGTLFRFWSYRRWVFLETTSTGDNESAEPAKPAEEKASTTLETPVVDPAALPKADLDKADLDKADLDKADLDKEAAALEASELESSTRH